MSANQTQLQDLLNGIDLANDGDVIRAEHHNSLRGAIGLIAGALPKIAAGQSPPGVGWQVYDGGAGLFLDVDTSAGGFTTTPIYITCLGGIHSHWVLTGGGAVYSPTPVGFRIYIRDTFAADAGTAQPTPANANATGWHVKWIGIQ